MQVKNVSKNTLFIEDIDLYIPYDENKCVELRPDLLKKSLGLQSMIAHGFLDVVNYDANQQIEKSILYKKNQLQQKSDDSEIQKTDINQKNSKSIEVKLKGIFYEAGGYGKVNRYLARNLAKAGIKVQVSPKRGQNHLNEDELRDIVLLEKTQIGKNHIAIDSIVPSFSEVSGSKYRFLYTTVEAYSVPKQFVECCNQYQQVLITAPFGYKILKEAKVKSPISIIPTGVDCSLYNEDAIPVEFNPKPKDFIFMSVFGWSYRKGYDLLFKAYTKAFTNKDNVSLLIFSRYMQSIRDVHCRKIETDIRKIIGTKSSLPHYKVVSKIIPEKLMPSIYKACNAFVLSSRGEGTNLPVCEASMCGLPVISTNVSGQTIYLKHDNSYLIEADSFARLPPGLIHHHYWDNEIFPKFTSQKCVNDLADLMRYVYENYDEAKAKNKKLQDLLRKQFTWEHASNMMVEKLKGVQL